MTYTHLSKSEIVKKINIDNVTQPCNLRDYFAGQALAGIMSNIDHDFGDEPHERISKLCYALADAMIKQREDL